MHPPRRPGDRRPRGRRRLGAALAASLALAPLASGSLGDTPFEPGLRWSYPAAAATPWIPTSVRFAARGEAVWTGGDHGAPRLALLAGGAGPDALPLLEDASLADAFPVLEAAAARAGDALLALAQRPAPDAWNRRTEVSVRGPLASGALGVRWSHDLGWIGNGPARVAGDAAGQLVVAALLDPAAARVRVDWLRGSDGALLARRELAASSLGGLAVAGDGSRVAIAVGTVLLVYDAAGAELLREPLATPARALAIARDGRALVLGEATRARLLREDAGGWRTAALAQGAPSELAARVAIAADASTWAVAWWDAASGVDVRLAVHDGPSGAAVGELVQRGAPGGLQNLPAALAISADGARVALGTWGDGAALPELVLVDRAGAAPVLTADLPGSVTDLDLDASGTRVAVALKHAHANQVAATGEVRLYDTGERVLRLVGQPRVGGALDLAFRHPEAQGAAVFLLGFRAAAPLPVPGAQGALLLDRNGRLWSHARPVDPAGAAELHLALPADPALFGLGLAAQVAWRRTDGTLVLSADLVEPTIL